MNLPPSLGMTPWAQPPVNSSLSPREVELLLGVYAGDFGEDPGVVFSAPGRRYPTQALLRSLHHLGVIEFVDAEDGGWERGMWAARLTCVGANAAFRHVPPHGGQKGSLDLHPGCGGHWLPRGTCDSCRAVRPLDRHAYAGYLAALQAEDEDRQRRAPRLYCIEHGFMRREHINTQKVCRLVGTHMHDGGLFRV